MNTQVEFDSLFGCVWRQEAPAEALADWILERLPSVLGLIAGYQFAPDEPHQPEVHNWASVYVFLTNGSAPPPFTIAGRFQVASMGLGDERLFDPATFAVEFPKWLTEQIDFLYYVLSK